MEVPHISTRNKSEKDVVFSRWKWSYYKDIKFFSERLKLLSFLISVFDKGPYSRKPSIYIYNWVSNYKHLCTRHEIELRYKYEHATFYLHSDVLFQSLEGEKENTITISNIYIHIAPMLVWSKQLQNSHSMGNAKCFLPLSDGKFNASTIEQTSFYTWHSIFFKKKNDFFS